MDAHTPTPSPAAVRQSDGPESAAPATAAARTLLRGLSLLEAVADAPAGVGVTEAADVTGLDKGTASRLLTTLRQQGYVQQRVDRQYVLGARVLWLVHAYQARHRILAESARPHLERLRDTTRETVHLAVRDGLSMVFIDQHETDRAVRIRSAIGVRLPLHHTAMGRAILALMRPQERDRLLSEIDLDARRSGTTSDVDDIRRDIELAQERGWAGIDRHDDVTRVAAAVVNQLGEPIAAITASGPSYRVDDHIDSIIDEVKATAAAISAALNT